MTNITAARLPATGSARPAPTAGRIDIVVPVYNEDAALEDSIRRLHAFLSDELPYAWRIVIADNASTDATLAVARALAFELDHIDRPAPGPQGPRPGAAGRLDGERRRRALLHGRRPVDRPARAAAARLAADLRPQRGGDRQPAGAGLPGRPRAPSASSSPAPTTGCCASACAPGSPTPSAGSRRSAPTPPAGCCPRSRTRAGSSTPSCWCSPSAAGCGSTRSPVDWIDDPDSRVDIVSTALTDLRGVIRLRLRRRGPSLPGDRASCRRSPTRCSTSCCAARWAPAAPTRWHWRSPRSPTRRPTAASPSGSAGRAGLVAPARRRRGRLPDRARADRRRARLCSARSTGTPPGCWRSRCWWWRARWRR